MVDYKQQQLTWLQKYLHKKVATWHDAAIIIDKLERIEDEYWISREEADGQTHIGEDYAD